MTYLRKDKKLWLIELQMSSIPPSHPADSCTSCVLLSKMSSLRFCLGRHKLPRLEGPFSKIRTSFKPVSTLFLRIL